MTDPRTTDIHAGVIDIERARTRRLSAAGAAFRQWRAMQERGASQDDIKQARSRYTTLSTVFTSRSNP